MTTELDLAGRIRQLEAKHELQDLLVRYSLARDNRDLEGLIGLFADDATFERRTRTVRGHSELREFFRQSMQRYALTLHTIDSSLFKTSEPEQAAGIILGHAELVFADGPVIVAAYRYDDTYFRLDAEWRIQSRRLQFLYALDPGTYAEGLSSGTQRVRWPGQSAEEADYPETCETWREY